jgi:hypothetical protein
LGRIGIYFVILCHLFGLCFGVAASSENRIALVGLAPDHALTRQLDAELRTLDFQVVVSEAPVVSWRELKDRARQLKVAAAVWITGIDQPTIEIWVVDLVTGKTVQRTIERKADGEESNSRVLAMRVIELLRASFREIETSPKPLRESEVKPSTAVRAMAVTREPDADKRSKKSGTGKVHSASDTTGRWSLALGPGFAWSIGGIAPSFQIAAGVNWLVNYPWGIAARVQAPAGSVTESGDNGSAQLFISHIAIGPYTLLLDPNGRWQPGIGIEVAWIAAYMQGEAAEPFEAKNTFASSLALSARPALVYLATEDIGVRVELQAGTVLPPLELRFAGQEQATWGRFYTSALLALEVGL